jgi:hypothetical protein
MGKTKLFVVTDSFFVKGRGLALIVDVPVHGMDKRAQIRETISVILPNNMSQDYEAVFEIQHFSMTDDEGKYKGKYAFVAILPTAKRDSIPTGSQVFGSDSAAAVLIGQQH